MLNKWSAGGAHRIFVQNFPTFLGDLGTHQPGCPSRCRSKASQDTPGIFFCEKKGSRLTAARQAVEIFIKVLQQRQEEQQQQQEEQEQEFWKFTLLYQNSDSWLYGLTMKDSETKCFRWKNISAYRGPKMAGKSHPPWQHSPWPFASCGSVSTRSPAILTAIDVKFEENPHENRRRIHMI